jgi:protein-tyrosine phosphatase
MDSAIDNPESGSHATAPSRSTWNQFFLTAGFGEAASGQYAAIFKDQEMEMDMLTELSHELLLQMGFTKAGARIRILRFKDAIINPQTGAIVNESNDIHAPVASFNHGGKTYQLRVLNEVSPLAPVVASTPAVSPVSKPILIPVNLEKKRSAHIAANATEGGSFREPPVRPASTSSLAAINANKPEGSVVPIPTASALEGAHMSAATGHFSTAPSSPDPSRRTPPLLSSAGAIHASMSDLQVFGTDSDLAVAEGTYFVSPETGEVVATSGPLSSVASTSALPLQSSSSSLPSSFPSGQLAGTSPSNGATSLSGIQSSTLVRYFMNDEVAKHRVRVQGEASVRNLSAILRIHHKLTQDFAIFKFDLAENRLRVLKDSALVDGSQVYYVLENARIDDLYRKVEKRVKKDLAAMGAQSGKTSTWNSDNNPLRVDFIPDNELYLGEAGRIGLCMCPGRKKKKAAHEWDRDLDKDLLRIRDHYQCDVVVSLVRRSELVELKIPTLLEEIEKYGMESIHFPIKDKWVPDSMAGLMRLVDTLVHRLRGGKTIVIHCNGGKGRSGTVAVACMVAMGKRVVQSIDVVRKARSGTIRNPVQVVYVKRFKKAFKSYLKKKQALLEARGGTMAKEDWETLAEQVAQDATMADDSEESESEAFEQSKREEKAAEKARKEEERAAEKARKEEEKTQEKARKEEEKTQEKARKEEERVRKGEEKAAEKARKEEEKTRKEGEKTLEKVRKEEEKAAKKNPSDSEPLARRKNTGTPTPVIRSTASSESLEAPIATETNAQSIANGANSSLPGSSPLQDSVEPLPISTEAGSSQPTNNGSASPITTGTPDSKQKKKQKAAPPTPTSTPTSNPTPTPENPQADKTTDSEESPVTPKRSASRRKSKKVAAVTATEDVVSASSD